MSGNTAGWPCFPTAGGRLTVLQNIAINEHNNPPGGNTPLTRLCHSSIVKSKDICQGELNQCGGWVCEEGGLWQPPGQLVRTEDLVTVLSVHLKYISGPPSRPHNNIYLSSDLTETFVFVSKSNKVGTIRSV